MLRRRPSRGGFTQVDVYALLFLGALYLLLLCIGPARSHESAYKEKCSANLMAIGKALLIYANDNDGKFPRTIYDPNDPAIRAYTGTLASNPFAPNGPKANDVTAAMYLLIRNLNVQTQSFICPEASLREPLDIGRNGENANIHSNFPSEKFLSYSMANPYPSPAATKLGYQWNTTFTSEFALVADMNPGTPELWKLTTQSSHREMQAGNSLNHFTGQNILYGDLHVEFQQSPFAGTQMDNIYGPGSLSNAGTPQQEINPPDNGQHSERISRPQGRQRFAAGRYIRSGLRQCARFFSPMVPIRRAPESLQLVHAVSGRRLGRCAVALAGGAFGRCQRER